MPSRDADVELHFICLVEKEKSLYELDGRRHGAVNRGPTTAARFLKDAAKYLQTMIDRDPDRVSFNMMALVKLPNEE